MITPDALRQYHRALARYCLAVAGECTAPELLEQMGMVALDAGHPREALIASTAAVAGLLRELDGLGHVERRNNKHSPRDGRGVPVWAARGEFVVMVPRSPAAHLANSGTTDQAAPSPFKTLSLDQRLAFMQIELETWISEREREHAAAMEKARQEWDALRERMKRVLQVVEPRA